MSMANLKTKQQKKKLHEKSFELGFRGILCLLLEIIFGQIEDEERDITLAN